MATALRNLAFFTACLTLINLNVFADPALASIKNLQQPNNTQFASGQPKAQEFSALKEAGILHIINLRPKSETPDFNEEKTVTENNMRYHNIPIASLADLTQENVKALDKLLKQIGNEKTLLHCASGNRVGAMMALRANWLQGKSVEESLSVGESFGLTRLKPAVSSLLK